MRYIPFAIVALLTFLAAALGAWSAAAWLWALALLAPLFLLGVYDLIQPWHSLRRLYPVSAHFRWLFEFLRPYFREYLLDSDHQGRPYSHSDRALIYRRAKNVESVQAFGTDMDYYSPRHEWIDHSLDARAQNPEKYRLAVGGSACRHPYSASVFNISAVSFGALSGHAIEALNMGAKMGGFYHNTGEGGISRYHLAHGGDLVWEIGSAYFGCRTPEGRFDRARFAERAALDQVKMIEIKLSQGAKPGEGGILPGAKVSPEIAATRGVPVGRDVISPANHSAFSTPCGLLEWIAELRELAGGKPVGFKLCIGHRWEFLAMTKAMLKTGITPDFIVIDGSEGGTGAAPAELTNHVGTPLREGLVFAVNALTGTNLRQAIRIAVAGKLVDGHDLASHIALGADWCNAARTFMFALGCVQTKKCHTDRCPTGVATQNRWREAGLVVADKGPRVYHLHRNTVRALSQYVASAGLGDPWQLRPHHLRIRMDANAMRTADHVYQFLAPGSLLAAPEDTIYSRWWAMADPERFAPAG